MDAPILYHSLVTKFQSLEQLKKYRIMQSGVAGRDGETQGLFL